MKLRAVAWWSVEDSLPHKHIRHDDHVGALHDFGGHLLPLVNPRQFPDRRDFLCNFFDND
jgi:hypothetical protein